MERNLLQIEQQLVKLFEKLDNLKIERQRRNVQPKFYRNKDLKRLFGVSSNTIIKYRENGILPYTFMGDIYLYPVSEIELLLKRNSTTSVNVRKEGGHNV
ncbi:helix-turn-helix domain-containing protein [Gramella sp. KN1008]|uniref:helix-turn-helix domain-containing protein n=1 Tax=Gramella sp. KN1008 TaxID=2529298 RepID=UPI00103E9950|nr:helix-turn-helix domain-containing protein [Gramella sp. KN1008]TBW28264.1 DNA-binding protein [Gramella sp. KN1008]